MNHLLELTGITLLSLTLCICLSVDTGLVFLFTLPVYSASDASSPAPVEHLYEPSFTKILLKMKYI